MDQEKTKEKKETCTQSQFLPKTGKVGLTGATPVQEVEPVFQTNIGNILWDIHSRKYPDRMVPHTEAAEIARLRVSTFTTMRSRNAGPPFIRLFGKPYYDLVQLIHWIESKMEFRAYDKRY